MRSLTRIVLIDDGRAWLEALSEYLEGKGFQVQAAASARVGFNMPDKDGLELLSRLRQQPSNVAVIMMSGQDEPEAARQALEAGARGFLSKTATPALLLRMVLQLAQKARRHVPFLPVVLPMRHYLPVPVREAG
jgi:two-component system uhpT operon response regulator UhpA